MHTSTPSPRHTRFALIAHCENIFSSQSLCRHARFQCFVVCIYFSSIKYDFIYTIYRAYVYTILDVCLLLHRTYLCGYENKHRTNWAYAVFVPFVDAKLWQPEIEYTHDTNYTHSVRVQNLDIYFTHLVRSMALTQYWACKNLDRRYTMCARRSIVVTRHWIHCATHCPFAGVPYTVLAPQQIKASEQFSSFRGCCAIVHQFIYRFVRFRCSGLISS